MNLDKLSKCVCGSVENSLTNLWKKDVLGIDIELVEEYAEVVAKEVVYNLAGLKTDTLTDDEKTKTILRLEMDLEILRIRENKIRRAHHELAKRFLNECSIESDDQTPDQKYERGSVVL